MARRSIDYFTKGGRVLVGILALPLLAAYPPQDPSASLDALLRDVWAKGADKAYELYMGKGETPMAADARQSFARRMLEIAQNANVGVLVLQKDKNEGYPKDRLPGPEAFRDAYFVHFIRPDFRGDGVEERIYMNVHPDHAADVMAFLVRDVLQRNGVLEAKVATPSGLVNRADSIVVYSRSLADVDWALGRVAEYQSTHRDHFLPDLPAATKPRMVGVSTAAEPAESLKAGSFGTYLANTIGKAMGSQPAPRDFEDFRQRVRSRMKADGVDPDHPDRLTRRP
jgi:hypothetical protein